jgi:hypothetical protein
MHHTPALVVGTSVAAYGALQVLGRMAGSTAEERRARLPGDDLVPDPQMVTDHGIRIHAPAREIWPWLTQLGWHLGGWYTPGWVDRFLFPDNWSSLDRLDPRLVRTLQVADTLPDGPPGTAEYVVDRVQPPHLLVLRSTTHLPPGWAEKYDARITWTWTLSLRSAGHGSTRVHLRVRGHMSPRWFAVLYVATIVPADYVMATGMLRGLKRRAEAGLPPQVSGRQPLLSTPGPGAHAPPTIHTHTTR